MLKLLWRHSGLRAGAIRNIGLSLLQAAAEILVVVSLIPILASLGVEAGDKFDGPLSNLSPYAWLGIFAAAAAIRSLVGWLSSLQEEKSTNELCVVLQSRLYRALASAHWDTVRKISQTKLTSALQTQAYDAGYGFSSLVQVTSATILVVGYVLSAAAVFPLMILVLGILLVIMWAVNVRRTSQVQSRSENYLESQTELHERYEDWVSISRISSLGVDADGLSDRFDTSAREAATHAVDFSRSSAETLMSYEAAIIIAILVGVPIAWWLTTPPALLAFGIVLIVRVLPRAANIHLGYQGIVSALTRVQAINSLAERLEKDPISRPKQAERLDWTALELKGIEVSDALRSNDRQPILRGINLSFSHGDWFALSGSTGAGKTTLADILLMLVRPDSGQILVDGQLVDDELANRWRDQCAYVPQDVVLFDASIRANLRLYVPDASDEELESALAKSAAEFVTGRLPDGLGTRVGPGGRWLSGGERQRLGIARALLRNPGFLVLDEPTAALDTDTQAHLMKALANLDHTMTVVLITHRPELLQLTDREINLVNGEIRSDTRH